MSALAKSKARWRAIGMSSFKVYSIVSLGLSLVGTDRPHHLSVISGELKRCRPRRFLFCAAPRRGMEFQHARSEGWFA